MADDLFRPEALGARTGNRWGRPVGLLPNAWLAITSLLTLLVVALLIFVSVAGFSRKETVRGLLRPDTNEARVFASEAGIVTDLVVKLGDVVEAGDLLAEIGTIRQIDRDTTLSDQSLMALRDERTGLEFARQSLKRTTELAHEQIEVELENGQVERENLERSMKLTRRRIEIAEDRVATYERLFGEGAASLEEKRAREEALIVQKQQLVEMASRYAASESRTTSLAVDLKKTAIEYGRQASEIDQRLAQISLQETQAQASAGFAVKAPISGRVAVLQVGSGERIDPNQPLLTILPENQTLFAEIFVPSRAIAFMAPGKSVKLLYDALPYQKFGSGSGVVHAVSETALSPQELRTSLRIEEPVYRVTVALDRQAMPAFGKLVPLQAGMELTADIILEERKLIEWLFEPIYAASKRM